MGRLRIIWLRIIWWLHKPLSLWLRTQSAPDDLPEGLNLEAGVPVVYALRNSAFSDHAVLQRVCRARGLPLPQSLPGQLSASAELSGACIYIPKPRRKGWWQGPWAKRPNRLDRLTEATVADENLAVQIVPVSVFWGRDPGNDASIWKLLFSDVENAGPLRKFFIVLTQGRNVFVNFGQPLSLQALREETREPKHLGRKLSRVLRVHFRKQRVATLGPSLSSRTAMINGLLGSEAIEHAMANEVAAGSTPEEARAKAERYADEIAADFTYSAIRLLDRILTWFWNRIFDGVEVYHVERLREIAKDHEVIYLPSHRSHLDYLLISYVLHFHGLVPPHIAAGINMNFWPVGKLLRRAGAFYLRRTFSGNPLYTAVFTEYVHTLITRGHSLKFFPEGGRSRTGRLLSARTGMLSMTVHSYLRDHQRPVVLLPVYLGYERLLEAGSYAKELQGGKKKKESIFELLKVFKVIRSRFGKTHLSFGKPIQLEDFLDEHRSGWRDKPLGFDERPEWLEPLVGDLAAEVTSRINCAVVANPVALLSLAMLAEQSWTIGEAELVERLDIILRLLRRMPYSSDMVLDESYTGASVLAEAEELAGVERIEHPWGDVLKLDSHQAATLTYYRNNIQHLVVLPGLVASLFQFDEQREVEALRQDCRNLYPLLKVEFSLRWEEDELDGILDGILEAMVDRGFLRQVGKRRLLGGRIKGRVQRPPTADPRFGHFLALGRIVRETLERYCLTAALLVHYQENGMELDSRSFTSEAELLAKRLVLTSGRAAPEYADKGLFRSHLLSLQERELVSEEDGHLKVDPRLRQLVEQALNLLGLEARQALAALLKHSETTEESTPPAIEHDPAGDAEENPAEPDSSEAKTEPEPAVESATSGTEAKKEKRKRIGRRKSKSESETDAAEARQEPASE